MIYQAFSSISKTTSLSVLLKRLDIDSDPVFRTPAQWRIVSAALRCCKSGKEMIAINRNSGSAILFSGYTYWRTRTTIKLSVQADIDLESASDPLSSEIWKLVTGSN